MTVSPSWYWPAALSALLLSACASRPAPQLPTTETAPATSAAAEQLTLQGQLGIKLQAFQGQEAKGINLGFFFSGNAQSGQLDLMTPMGSQVAQVRWTRSTAWLQTDKGEQLFDSLWDLSEQVLGEPLPLSALMHWAQGHPAPDLPPPTDVTPTFFEQSGWRIDTQDVSIGRINAQRAATPAQRGITMRVRLD